MALSRYASDIRVVNLILLGFWAVAFVSIIATFALALRMQRRHLRELRIRGQEIHAPRIPGTGGTSPAILAEQLWLASLTPAEREQWTRTETITIQGSDRRSYTLGSPRRSYNVLDHKTGHGLCAYPLGVPIHDKLLAQKLLLQTNARQFRKRANTGEWAYRSPGEPLDRAPW